MYVNVDVHKVICIVCFIFAVPDVHCHIVCMLLCFILSWLIYANKHQYGIFFEFERDKERR